MSGRKASIQSIDESQVPYSRIKGESSASTIASTSASSKPRLPFHSGAIVRTHSEGDHPFEDYVRSAQTTSPVGEGHLKLSSDHRAHSLDAGLDQYNMRHSSASGPEDSETPRHKHIKANNYTWLYNVPKKQDIVLPPESSLKRRSIESYRLLSKIGHGASASHQQHKLKIHRIHHISWMYELYLKDIFHTLVNLKLRYLLLLFLVLYMFAFCVLACCFLYISERCGLGMQTFSQAFAFSVETWLTIGYGVDDPPGPYMRQCKEGVVLITVQGLLGLIMNALLVGIVITSVSSGAFRGCTLIFSEKAVIREVGGRLYLMMQVCEMRSTQLLEAHVRAYVIRRPASSSEVPVDAPQAFELRLVRPDDTAGALMLPVFPSVIVHEIDRCSPLGPMPTHSGGGGGDPLQGRHWSRPPVRTADADSGGRDVVWCRTCGESFLTDEMLQAHIAYQAEQDALSGAKVRPHRVEQANVHAQQAYPTDSWREMVTDFLESEWFEILCILEGVDTMTAATVQARHSYVAEDIVWDHTFAPIFSLSATEGAVINFTQINDLVEALPEPAPS